ncbi:hypothetical protein HY990_07380 [Candidatus Micrarchaeota archaeon]|nr:hypothetical protein [Candidatus Micrarchaeota archaeon]
MGFGKGAYLKKLISSMPLPYRSKPLGSDLDGSSPPSVFIGTANYPKVFAGPMMADTFGDTSVLDTPEQWLGSGKSQQDIIGFRLGLVRGTSAVGISDLDNRMVKKLQEISLASDSVSGHVKFKHIPRGVTFDEETSPYGPSASLDSFSIDNPRWNPRLEKVYHDTDLLAKDALVGLYRDGVLFSQLQKALSTGTMGIGKNRKLVPTKWSITAADTTLADHFLSKVRYHPILDRYLTFEFSSLNNYYLVLLLPSFWQYEWFEAFIHILGKEENIFSDWEGPRGKKEYSSVGGCYYSCKFSILEALDRMRVQAGAIVLREAYEEYVPLGVFNVRENVRHAMLQKPREFESLRSALTYASSRLRLPLSRFIDQSHLLKDLLVSRQTTL